MLWIAPSLPYYQLGGAYRNAAAAAFTKRLVFSAWTAVPRAIAALTSYEAERRIMRPRPGRATRNTPAGRERVKPLLRLRPQPGTAHRHARTRTCLSQPSTRPPS